MSVKRVAMVSEGPSALETYPGRDGYDEVVAVNGVAAKYSSTVWVFLDPEFYVWYLHDIPEPRPHIVTPRRLMRAVHTNRMTGANCKPSSLQLKAAGLTEQLDADIDAGRITFTDEIGPLPPMPQDVPIRGGGPQAGEVRWDMHGGLAGLVAAWWIGGKGCTIDVYGVDLWGSDDLRGHEASERLGTRWRTERAIFRALIHGFERAHEARINWVTVPRLANWCTKDVNDPATPAMARAATTGKP